MIDHDRALEFCRRVEAFANDLADEMKIGCDDVAIQVTYRMFSPDPVKISVTLGNTGD